MIKRYCEVDVEYNKVDLNVEVYVEYDEYIEKGCASKDGDPGDPPIDSITVDSLRIMSVYVADSEYDILPMLTAPIISILHDMCIEEVEAGNFKER